MMSFPTKTKSFLVELFSVAWVNFNGIHALSETAIDTANLKNNSDIDPEGNCAYRIVNTDNNMLKDLRHS